MFCDRMLSLLGGRNILKSKTKFVRGTQYFSRGSTLDTAILL